MRDVIMTTSFVAPLARRDKTAIYQWFNTPECQEWLPPKTGIGESRSFTPDQAILLMIHSDLNRWGIPVPMAGRLVTQIARAMAEEPQFKCIANIVFYENGRSQCVLNTTPFTESTSIPRKSDSGDLRFSLTIDIAGYRGTIREAIEAVPQVIGGEDGE